MTNTNKNSAEDEMTAAVLAENSRESTEAANKDMCEQQVLQRVEHAVRTAIRELPEAVRNVMTIADQETLVIEAQTAVNAGFKYDW